MKPLFMITNDDGIYSPGLAAAARAALKLGDVLIAAPITQQTAMGRAFPRTEDLGIIEEVEVDISPDRDGSDKIKGYGVHGSPGYVAAYGIAEIAPRLGISPDLTISGINYGANIGASITCSGTLGAALESASIGVPTLAMSLETDASITRNANYESLNFQSAEESTEYWLRHILSQGMPRNCSILNVNVPYRKIDPKEYKYTFMELQNYYEIIPPEPDRDWSKPRPMYYDIQTDSQDLTEGSDVYAVCREKLTSVTPLTMDMTKH